MAFKNGHIKQGGREKGTPNEMTKELREVLQTFLSIEIQRLPEYFEAIPKPEVKAKLIIELLPFILPKQNFLELDNSESNLVVTISGIDPPENDEENVKRMQSLVK